MPVVFYDDFNRANGPPGAGWTVQSGTWAIDGNTLKSSVAGIIRSNTAPAGANVACFLQVPAYGGSVRTYAFRLRQSADFTYYALVQFSLNAANIVVTIAEAAGGSQYTLATRTIAYSPGVSTFLMATASGDKLSANVDSNDVLHVKSDAAVYQGTCAIVTSYSNTVVDDWWQYDLETDAWTIAAEAVEGYPGRYSITLHNPAADWTPGTPGVPTFTCQAGTITAQEVTDSETAVLVYEAPEMRALEIFLDDYNGVTFPLELTNPAGASGTGGGGTGLNAEQAETLDWWHELLEALRTGGNYSSEFLLDLWGVTLHMSQQPTGGGDVAILRTMNAILDATDGVAAIKNRVDLINDKIDTISQDQGYTLPSVQEVLRGTSSRDLTQVYDLIDALEPASATDVTSILNAIAAIRTANQWTLEHVRQWIEDIPAADVSGVLAELAAIRTASLWTLEHVRQWILDINIPDYSTQLDDIAGDVAAIPTNTVTSLQPVLDAISTHNTQLNTQAGNILDAIDAIPTNPITSLQSVLDVISNLDGDVAAARAAILAAIALLDPAAQKPQAPIWPGLANVTMGSPVAIGQTFGATVACDGVIVNITGDSLARGVYGWGDVTQHPRALYVSFQNDGGAFEDVQSATFPSQCLCPKLAVRAAGFIGRARAGITGSVTPWTINAA